MGLVYETYLNLSSIPGLPFKQPIDDGLLDLKYGFYSNLSS